MLKNMKVKKSLILGFGTTILVSIIVIIISLFMLVSQSSRYQDLIHQEIQATQLITECRMNANIAARTLRNMALTPGDPSNASMETRINEATAELDAKVKELEAVYPLKDNALNEYITAVKAWENELPNIITAVNRGDGERAIDLIRNDCTPQLDAMADMAQKVSANLTEERDHAIEVQQMSVVIAAVIVVVIMVISTILIFLMNLSIIKSIVRPVEQVRTALVGFSEGNLEIPVEFESKNELGDMCRALRTSQHVLSEVIGDICRLVEEMGNGNFNVRTKDENMYVGALKSVLTSIRAINHNLSDTLAQITLSAEQVAAGAEQVSTGAQALAQGATEQASAVEELSATIAEISSNSQNNAKYSQTAMEQSEKGGVQVAESSKYMEEMVEAMAKISGSSQEIGKIIDTIENIAFQTNILALNAAVEAARAGSAGKGFAVVADEVRNLASKSDQAAKATKELIDRSISSVQQGNEIVKQVSDSLSKTVELSRETMEAIEKIAKAIGEESEAITQVTEGIDQISSVVQTNSATSEESAAASEELSSQASLIKELMTKFRLRSTGTGDSFGALPAASSSAYAAPAPVADTSMDYDTGFSGGSVDFSKY